MNTLTNDDVFKQYTAREKQQFNYAREISQPYKEIDNILDWCKRELNQEWRWQLIDVSSPSAPGRYIFYFDDNRDYFAFTLKWG